MRISIFLILLLITVSCDNSQAYEAEAEKICSCMKESTFMEETAQELEVNLGICLLGAKVNLKDQQMISEIEKQCPEFGKEYKDFVNRLKTND